MKLKLFFLMCLLFETLIFVSSLNVLADSDEKYYEIGIEESDEFTYVCNTFQEEKMKDSWGSDWDDNEIFQGIEQGKRMKWKIIDIDEEYRMYSEKEKGMKDSYKIEYEIWFWSTDEKFANIDSEEEQYSWLVNPENYEENLHFETIIVPWIPVVSNEYLEDLEFYQWWYINDGKLIYELSGSDREIWYDSDLYKDDILTETTYTEQGILSSFKILNEEHETILEFTLENEVAYIIPLIIIVIFIFAAVAIILLVMRKRGVKISAIKKVWRRKTGEQVKN